MKEPALSGHLELIRSCFGDFPGLGITQQLSDQRIVQSVAGADGFHAAQDRSAQQRQVTDEIHDLVTNEFVREAKRFLIEEAVAG